MNSEIHSPAGSGPSAKNCQNCHRDFVIESEDFNFYEKIKVPAPTFCPLCRMQRRMSWHNERYLFRRKSDKSGKEIFSMFPPEASLVVWDKSEWILDDWDQHATAKEYDFSKPFFQQFKELMRFAPVPSRAIVQPINSDYANNATYPKDCYLVFGCSYVENCAYLENSAQTKDSLDCTSVVDSELSYECFFNAKCYKALYSSHCENCQEIYFCRDCSGSSNLFGCVGLKGKSYYIFNEPHSKEEYEKRLREMRVNSYANREALKKQVADFWLQHPVRYAKNIKSTNSSGEYISNSKNVQKSYYVVNGENLKYCQGLHVKSVRDSYDQYRYGNNSELIYEGSVVGGDSANIKFSYHVYDNCNDVEYSWGCTGSSFLFGCIGLKKAQYCIFNKQYSKEEYETLRPKIIEHMNGMPYVDKKGIKYVYGEFFPSELSPVSYNQSVAIQYFPISQGDAMAQGYWWLDSSRKEYAVTLPEEKIPDSIAETDDSILSEVIGCAGAGGDNHDCVKVFRITLQELNFYKKLDIPVPHLCPNCRHAERTKQRNPVQLWHRQCMCDKNHPQHSGKCLNGFETSYAPNRPEIVYCEQCYQAEVA